VEQRLTVVSLGVTDLDRALRFYRDGLGWRLWSASSGDFAMFVLKGGVALALYPLSLLAEDAGVADLGGFGGITLAHNLAGHAEVDALLKAAVKAGGRLLKAATEKEWGGYSGYFADPDGHPWEVAWNPHLPLLDGMLNLAE
jgi:catechol 2,3-dioxygenase-like lactoylglutathione lyase family enzyme